MIKTFMVAMLVSPVRIVVVAAVLGMVGVFGLWVAEQDMGSRAAAAENLW